MSLPGTEAGPPPRPMRADARRNYDRLLAAAAVAFTADGPDASLEDIARHAGVGIGTLYRHFPTRAALLEASYLDQIESLCAQARDLADDPSPGAALTSWLHIFAAHNLRYRGLKGWLGAAMQDEGSPLSACKTTLRSAAGVLLTRAQQAGAIRPDLTVPELLRLVHAIILTAEIPPVAADQIDRLLSLLLDGLRQPAPPA
jgi:AcrR family transcriptional regulator